MTPNGNLTLTALSALPPAGYFQRATERLGNSGLMMASPSIQNCLPSELRDRLPELRSLIVLTTVADEFEVCIW